MKKIFYYTDVLPLLDREGGAIEKLKRSLDIFRENSDDVRLVWHPMTRMTECLELNNSPVLEDYKKIVDDYLEKKWGEFDTSETLKEAREVLLECDGYYGDLSNLLYEAQTAKIPAMVQNIDV
jgi:hypothetical protein